MRAHELVGQGMLANLLHLTRVGKLDIDLMRKIVHDPKQLSLLMDNIKLKGLSGKASAQDHRAIGTPPWGMAPLIGGVEAQENVEE